MDYLEDDFDNQFDMNEEQSAMSKQQKAEKVS